MPTLRSRTKLELGRTLSVALTLEAGLTGLGSAANYLGTRLGSRPALTGLAARLRNGPPATKALGAASPPQAPGPDGPRKGPLKGPASGRPAGDPPDGEVPIFFVVGMAKSGTTWLMNILDAHPEVMCKGEGRFFGADWRREALAKVEGRQQPSSLYNALLGDPYLRMWVERSVWSRDGDPGGHLDALMGLAVRHFMASRLRGSGKRVVGDKTPLLGGGFVGEISRACPGARVIHIVRDGRDQAVSFIHQGYNRAKRGGLHQMTPEELANAEARRSGSREAGGGLFSEEKLRHFARNWVERVGETVEDGPALFGEAYKEVRYEGLLEDTEGELMALFGFLGVEAGEEVARRCADAASFEKLSKGRERGQEDPASFFRKGVAGDWRNHFTERDKEIYKEEAGELLIRLGYEENDEW